MLVQNPEDTFGTKHRKYPMECDVYLVGLQQGDGVCLNCNVMLSGSLFMSCTIES